MFLLLLLAGSWVLSSAQDFTYLSTVAGGWVGDGGPAADACLNTPRDVEWHPTDGSLLIADSMSYRVWLVHANSTITVLAGSGRSGFSGDGGPASLASIMPNGIAWDVGAGRAAVIVADSGNNRIRRVDMTTKIISTIAGGGSGGDGPALSVQLSDPRGVAVSSRDGSIYFTEAIGGHRLRCLRTDGLVTTIIGVSSGLGFAGFSSDGPLSSSSRLDLPLGIAVNSSDGAVYVTEYSTGRVRRISLNAAGGGIAMTTVTAVMRGPHDVAISPVDGSLYIADMADCRVRRIGRGSTTLETVAGTGGYIFAGDGGPAVLASMRDVHGVSVRPSDGAIAIAEGTNGRVRLVNSSSGIINTFAGGRLGDGGPATASCLRPTSVVLDPADGSLLVSESM